MKEFTSFDVAAVVLECRDLAVNSRVSNVYQLDEKTLLFKLRKVGAPSLGLVLEAGERLHLTGYALEKPPSPPAFCMSLRKYLRNSRLLELEQYEFERVIILSFETYAGTLKVVLELFGEGNIILVGADGKILQALLYKRMRDRDIVREETFRFAPSTSTNPMKISWDEFASGLKSFGNVEIVRAVARLLGVGGVYAEEILLRAGLDKTKSCADLAESEMRAVFDNLNVLLSQISSRYLEPCIVLDRAGNLVDATPLRLRRYEVEGFRLQFCESFNKALDEYYTRVLTVEKALAGADVEKFESEAQRLKRIISDQEKVVAEAEAKVKKNRQIGDTIYAHLSDLQSILDRFSAAKIMGNEWKTVVSEIMKEKQASVQPSTMFEYLDNKELAIYVNVDGFSFSLDLRRTLFENAARYYERSKREKQRLEGAENALSDSKARLADVETKIREAEASKYVEPAKAVEALEKRKIRRKEWFEKFRWFITSDDFLVVAGKDAVSNEVLIKRHTDESDIVFHAEIPGAPFVVVKAGGKKPSEQCLKEAGEFAAAFSRGWREGFGSVDIYWVRPEQLSKAGPSGEYVRHGAFVVRGERNWMRGVSLKLALGVAVEDNCAVRLIGGPVDAVRTKTDYTLTIAPGDLTGKELLKQIQRLLARKVPRESRDKVLNISTEEIQNYVPFGIGRVEET